ncbi:MAG: hypothetical protein JNJ53_14820 [Rhizobiales bacterium]|nr:hypothetical protein [Hyphomicrobiales bacterium]
MTNYDEAVGAAFQETHRSEKARAPSELVDQVLDASKNLGGVVGKEARAMLGRVTEQVSETAEAGVDRGADALGSLVRAMHAAGNEVNVDSPGLARSIDEAASHVEAFAETIRGRSLSELASSAAELAKRNPTVFLAGAIVAGFAVSRFVRSSAPADAASDNRYEG